jgi:integrase
MARVIGRLTALKVQKARKPGMYADGGGLYLRVTNDGAKNWVFRFMLNGRPRWMGMGPLALYGLQESRAKAVDARRRRHEGSDPIEARKAERAQTRLDETKAITFKDCADAYIKSHRAGWRNPKHAAQWEATLVTYADPIIGKLPVQGIDMALVLKVLEPIWASKSETAGRIRGRIEAVLDWAKVHGYRTGDNPARWRGHLDVILPARSKVRKVQHHAAMPYASVPGFSIELRSQEGIAPRALEFAILTAARTGEVLGARWSEISLHEKVWVVPAERMKAGAEHRVPLSARAVSILDEMQGYRRADDLDGFVFLGGKAGKPLSNMALLMTLRRMSRDGLTAHGFRSSFRDWCSERTNFPSAVAELALAHTVSDKTIAAYNRSDLFERRRRLMHQWATFCNTPKQEEQGKVTAMVRA